MTHDTAPFDPQAPDPRARRRRLWPYVGLGLLAALITLGLWPKAVPAELAVAARGELRVTIDEEGRTRVRNRYIVSSPVGGYLRRIDLKPGAPVVAGETILAELETAGSDLLDASGLAQAEARVRAADSSRAAAEARHSAARAAATLARAELKRAKSLSAQRVSSPQDLEIAEARATTAAQDERAAGFAAQVAGFELDQARAALHRGLPETAASGRPLTPNGEAGPSVVVRSPVNGRILRVWQESARRVTAGAELIEVGDPTDLEVLVEVLSRDGVAAAPGAPVTLERWGGEGPLQARVRLVEPAAFTKISALGVEEQRVNLLADFTDPPERRAGLGDAYRVEARIVVWENRDVLRVPSGALFQRGGAWRTFVVEGGRARLRTVEAGRTNGLQTQVISGLAAGETVVVYPGDRVEDGTRVRALTIAR